MKISLLTIWHEKNYGAEMQAYATVKILQELGHTVELINFRLHDLKPKSIKSLIKNLITFCTPEDIKFQQFWAKYIPTTKRYKTIKSLYENPPEADLYLIGSDQVWNPEITKQAASLFFLDFGNSKIPRVSYASSFGVSSLASNLTTMQYVCSLLPKYKAISCREESGVVLLQNECNLNAVRVIDPTLLFNGYPELIGIPAQLRTLVYYPLSPYLELENFSQDLAKELDLQYINTNYKQYIVGSIVWNRPSIKQWIKNIADGALVVTPSFHGVAFSLIYRRQFIVIIKDKSRSSRITDLLSELGLSERCFFDIQDAKKSRIWEKTIDYSAVDTKLSALRSHSIHYLKEVLK